MENIMQAIRERRSVRTFDGRELTIEDREDLCSYMRSIENPYKIPVEFRLMSAKENDLLCPVVSGTDLYVGGKIKHLPEAEVAFGYSFEMLVLYAESIGVGTVWLAGTLNRSAYEKAMELSENEIMPCVSPLGYPAKKMSIRESVMRKKILADQRLPFEELFFDGAWNVPLTKEGAGYLEPLFRAVRLAPSSVNRQPWRILVCDHAVHFYLNRKNRATHPSGLDIQKVDMGIALCHFALAAQESSLGITFSTEDPPLTAPSDMEYIASYRIEK